MATHKHKKTPARLTIFNHKGGVGKTTLTVNLAATLANRGRRVLLVDTDPQCNLTSYLIPDDVVDNLLDNADSKSGQTLWSAVKPLSEATGGYKLIKPLKCAVDNLLVLPGDVRLSEFENDLNDFWAQCFQRKIKGFKGTTAISELVDELVEMHSIEYVFYDSGPNIGPLNRSVLMDCDYFIVPVACDLFSLRALKTLGRTMSAWINDWSTISNLAPEGTYLLGGKPSLLGYVPGRFRVYGGTVVAAQSKFLSNIEREIHSQVVIILRRIESDLAIGNMADFKLGEIKDFGSLIPASQEQGVPIYSVSIGTPDQKASAKIALEKLADKVESRISELSK